MNPNPMIGVFYHWLGGLASGSFYVPYRGVKRWAWETFWLAGGFFSWIIAPWFFAFFMTRDLLPVLHETSEKVLFWTFFFGLLWGIGGLTFGLTMRYLGLSLGMAIVLGLCAAFGTLIPPIFRGEFMSQVLGTPSGRIILLGIFVCLVGITCAGLAGIYKERAMSPQEQKVTIKEFDLKKGIGVATLSGVMSACFAYGLAAGDPIKALTIKHGTPDLWQGLPVLVVVLLGGFTTNFVWCLILNVRNKTGYQYFTSISRGFADNGQNAATIETAVDAPGREVAEHMISAKSRPQLAVGVVEEELLSRRDEVKVPVLRNYLLCALAGTTWYFQFFFYSMGETQMGRYKFSSWTLHMASIIIFSSLWGIGLKEWKGAGTRAGQLLALALALLVGSTVIVGYGNYLGMVLGAAKRSQRVAFLECHPTTAQILTQAERFHRTPQILSPYLNSALYIDFTPRITLPFCSGYRDCTIGRVVGRQFGCHPRCAISAPGTPGILPAQLSSLAGCRCADHANA
jgi:L-rhamnose-H+ transport protein